MTAHQKPRRPPRPSKTLSRRELVRLVVLERHQSEPIDHDRPRTRADCENGPRPCPYVGCKYHLYLDVGRGGSLKLNYPHLEPEELQHSCALDPDVQGISLLEIQHITGLTKQALQSLQIRAVRKLEPFAGQLMEEMLRGG